VQINVTAYGTCPTSDFCRTWSMQYGLLIVHDYSSVVYSVDGGELISWLSFTWGFLLWKFMIMKYKRAFKRLQSITKTRSNVFRSYFWRTSLLYPTWWCWKLHFEAMAKFLSDNADVLQTLYNVPLSAASAVALNQCSSNVRHGGRKRLFSRKQRPMLIFDAQFQTCAPFRYLLYDNAVIIL